MRPGQDNSLQNWFGLSYASWLTLPRVLMEAMPQRWQQKMASLLYEYEATFPNRPELGSRVQVTKGARLVRTPSWIANYRHPDRNVLRDLMRKPRP